MPGTSNTQKKMRKFITILFISVVINFIIILTRAGSAKPHYGLIWLFEVIFSSLTICVALVFLYIIYKLNKNKPTA